MIHPQELNIGNWLLHNEVPTRIFKVEQLFNTQVPAWHINEEYVDEHTIDEVFQPILLTPELIKKCGFVEDEASSNKEKGTAFVNDELVFFFLNNEGHDAKTALYYKGVEIGSCNYLHRLQNLYNGIKAKELEVNI